MRLIYWQSFSKRLYTQNIILVFFFVSDFRKEGYIKEKESKLLANVIASSRVHNQTNNQSIQSQDFSKNQD